MATSKGVIQGYVGMAAVDSHSQIIVEAQAHGHASEQSLLIPMVDSMRDLIETNSLITADAGMHSEENLKQLAQRSIDALIADNGMRKRDERFAEQRRHKMKKHPLHDKRGKPKSKKQVCYSPADFKYDANAGTCICPAGKKLYGNGSHCVIGGYAAVKLQGAKRDCEPCAHRQKCLRTPEKTKTRQVSFFQGKVNTETVSAKMKRRIDSEVGRRQYAQRFATVEPVFGNLRHNKRLNRFTLRGRKKVDTQWELYCLVHNIEKLAHYGVLQ